jgi:outer membrane protein
VKPYEVGENVMIDVAQIKTPEDLKALVAKAYSQRLELKALNVATESLKDGSSAAAMGELPRLDAFGDVTAANPNPMIFPQEEKWKATWAVGLSLSWTINDTFSGSAQSSQLDAMRMKLEADRESLERGIKLEVTAAYYDVKKARVAIETSTRASASAKEGYRVARDLYQVGRATTTDLISAETELVAASIKEINAAIDYHVARVKLAYATGSSQK